MGSGHILCYLFDVLVKIYESYGYSTREAVSNIVEKNLWGLDIDDRASQLAYFAVMMKARRYDSRFFERHLQPHVYAVEESNSIAGASMGKMGTDLSNEERTKSISQIRRLIAEMHDAKEYGSIIEVTPCDWDLLRRFAVIKDENNQMSFDVHGDVENTTKLQQLINVGEALAQKYHVVVTNPPYMGSSGMNQKLSDFLKKKYPDTKMDLFACFIEKGNSMVTTCGFNCMVTMQSWMFLSSFEKMRINLLNNYTISSLMHMDNMVMGIAFGTAVTTFRNIHISVQPPYN